MGVDLYCGSLERYFSGKWETPAARFAREQNIGFQTVYSGAGPRWLNASDVAHECASFRHRVEANAGALKEWLTGIDAPYEVWQITAHGISSLVLCAACAHRPEFERPKKLVRNIETHPAVSEADAQNYYLGPMAIFESHMIVPGLEARICADRDPIDRDLIITTTAALTFALDAMRDYLEVGAEDLETLIKNGPPSWDTQEITINGDALPEVPPPDDEVRDYAIWAMACLEIAAKTSALNGSVLVRDE